MFKISFSDRYKIKAVLLAMILVSSNLEVFGQEVDNSYSVARWKGFADAAVSYTWDDNTSKQLTVAMPLYDKFDFKITFFTVTSFNPNWASLKLADQNGHEVASHSVTHTSFADLSDAAEEEEQVKPQTEINKQLDNDHCVTFAYPNCIVGNKSITTKYYISARGCNGQIEQSTPSDFMNVGSIACGTNGSIKTTEDFNSKVDGAADSKGWAVFLLHGIDNDGGWSPVESSTLSSHLAYMDANRNKFWIDTYGNVVRYIKERNAVSLHETYNKDSIIGLSVTHNLDQKIYNFPITIRREIPVGWENVKVSQRGKQIQSEVISKDDKSYLTFDVIPNNGPILIVGANLITGNEDDVLFTPDLSIYPNPVDSTTQIQFLVKHSGSVSIQLIDQYGKKVKEILAGHFEAGKFEYTLDITALPNAVYYCILSVNGKMQTKKLLLIK